MAAVCFLFAQTGTYQMQGIFRHSTSLLFHNIYLRLRCHSLAFSDTCHSYNLGAVSYVAELGFVFQGGMGHVLLHLIIRTVIVY